jgi:transcriptional regulator with XRE-family HTH domain
VTTFAERFKMLRIEKGLNQQQLANIFYTNKSSISRYESGQQVPEIDTIKKYAEYFNVSLDYLTGISEVRDLKTDINAYTTEKCSKFLKAYMDFYNLNVLDIANKLDVPEYFVYGILASDEKFKPFSISSFANALGVSVSSIMNLDTDFKNIMKNNFLIKDEINHETAIKLISEKYNIPVDVLKEQLLLLKKVYENK